LKAKKSGLNSAVPGIRFLTIAPFRAASCDSGYNTA